jgi:hypothetical protein
MKKILFALIILLITCGHSFGQKHKAPFGPPEEVQKKIEELEKIKLMEVLDLKDEVMLKFFARRKNFLDKFHQMENEKNNKIDELEEAIGSEDEPALKKRIDEINSLEQNITKNHIDYLNSLSDILDYKQIAKVIVFDRNFRRELRDMILKHRMGKP